MQWKNPFRKVYLSPFTKVESLGVLKIPGSGYFFCILSNRNDPSKIKKARISRAILALNSMVPKRDQVVLQTFPSRAKPTTGSGYAATEVLPVASA